MFIRVHFQMHVSARIHFFEEDYYIISVPVLILILSGDVLNKSLIKCICHARECYHEINSVLFSVNLLKNLQNRLNFSSWQFKCSCHDSLNDSVKLFSVLISGFKSTIQRSLLLIQDSQSEHNTVGLLMFILLVISYGSV